MDATVDSETDNLLFEPILPSPADSQSWIASEEASEDEILQNYLEESQYSSITELDAAGETLQAPIAQVPDRYSRSTPTSAHLIGLGSGSLEE